jgi:hypothetical protein
MRRLGLLGLVVACGCLDSSVPARVALPRVTARTTVQPVPPSDAMPPGAVPVHSGAGGAWARDFPAAESFRAYDAGGAGRVLLTWRIGPTHVVVNVPGGDYPVNHVSAVELVLHARGRDTVVPLGDLPGAPPPIAATYCKNRGFHPDCDGGWEFPGEPNVASAFRMDMIQGSDDFVVVRDRGTLHVLHRQSSDGHCEAKKQGPLDACDGDEYARVAEIHVGAAELFETVDDQGSPFDCGADRFGMQLVFP